MSHASSVSGIVTKIACLFWIILDDPTKLEIAQLGKQKGF